MSSGSTSSEESRFLQAIRAGDLETVGRMVQTNPDLLFVQDDYYGSPVRMAAATHPEIADYLGRVELQRIRGGSIPESLLYSAIHDLGEATHFSTGYPGCENLRAETEPEVVALLKHPNEEIRCIAVSVLTFHWGISSHRDELVLLLRHDPDDMVRSTAAAGLGFVLRDSRDPIASQALVERVQDSNEDPFLRVSAYDALRDVWSSQRVEQSVAEIKAKAEIQRQKELQAARSHEEFQRKWWWWRDHQETLSRIDWEFVRHVEQTIQGKTPNEPP